MRPEDEKSDMVNEKLTGRLFTGGIECVINVDVCKTGCTKRYPDVGLDDEMGRAECPRSEGRRGSNGMKEHDTIHIALGGIVHYS